MEGCSCRERHTPKKVVLTGGPGAGKTAVLELVRRQFCRHLRVLPEAASILFEGGFPRSRKPSTKHPLQRAIYHVQRELEAWGEATADCAVLLCDRGTVDGAAYWPEPPPFWEALRTTRQAELARYAAVIHLRVPSPSRGYNHANPHRIETPEEAAAIDEKILALWEGHPRRVVIESEPLFFDKAGEALEALRRELPPCCALAKR